MTVFLLGLLMCHPGDERVQETKVGGNSVLGIPGS